jgi:predicted cupin superfamily sugar epimerase
MTAEEIIESLGLIPHPEGGGFRETFRAKETVHVRGERSIATAIYYLLRAGEQSAWHRVASDELWFFHGGDPLTIETLGPRRAKRSTTLGMEIESGARPQILVPAGAWQSASPVVNGVFGWTLVSCVVSPGFDFADFEMGDPADP